MASSPNRNNLATAAVNICDAGANHGPFSALNIIGATSITPRGTQVDIELPAGGGAGSVGAVNTVQTSDGAGAFLGATDVLAASGFISIGATPASAGYLRFPTTSTVVLAFEDTGSYRVALEYASGGTLFEGTSSAYDKQCADARRYFSSNQYAGIGSATYSLMSAAYQNSFLKNIGLVTAASGVVADYQSGVGCIFVGNTDTAPTGDPVGGGILFADAGAGKWHGSGGTVTPFGPADPHCPTCGRDFALQWDNDTFDEHLSVCVPCLLDALTSAGINTKTFAFRNELTS